MGILIGAILVSASPPSVAEESARIGVVASEEMVWAYREMSGRSGARRVWRFGQYAKDRDRRIGWGIPFQAGEVVGDLRLATVRGTRLHVWYGDGTHRWYEPMRSGVGVSLPDSAVPLALAGGGSTAPLYAIVRRSVALAIKEPPSEATESDSEADLAADDATAVPPEAPAQRWPNAKWVLVRLEGGRWHGDRGMPNDFDPAGEVWLLAGSPKVVVIYQQEPGAAYEQRVSADSESGWSGPTTIAGLAPGSLMSGVIQDGELIVVARVRSGEAVATVTHSRAGWVQSPALTTEGLGGVELHEAAFAIRGSRVIGVWPVSDDEVRSAEWALDGSRATDLVVVRPLQSAVEAQAWYWRQVVLAYVVLALVLAAVFFRRRESVVAGVVLPPELRLVRHPRRLAAFLVDAIVFTPCVIYAYRQLVASIDPEGDMTTLLQAARVDGDAMRNITLYWSATVLSFIVYATIFEAWLGATPGKRLLGMRVVDEHGRKCLFWRIAVRNVLRCVELYPFLDLAPTLVLIVLTRNRQRLGDLIGGTVVVEPNPAEPPHPLG